MAGYVSANRGQLALYSAPGRPVTLGPLPSATPLPKQAATRRSSTGRRISNSGAVATPPAPAAAAKGGAAVAPAAGGAAVDATAAAAGAAAAAASPLRPPGGPTAVASAPDAPCGTHFSAADTGFLLRWLNGAVLRQPIAAFPGDLVAAHGRPLLEAIESLSGRSLPGRVTGRVPTSKKERAVVLFAQARWAVGGRSEAHCPHASPPLLAAAVPRHARRASRRGRHAAARAPRGSDGEGRLPARAQVLAARHVRAALRRARPRVRVPGAEGAHGEAPLSRLPRAVARGVDERSAAGEEEEGGVGCVWGGKDSVSTLSPPPAPRSPRSS